MSYDKIFSYLIEKLQTEILPGAFQFGVTIAPIVLVFILALTFWPLWLNYIRSKSFLTKKFTLLEIKIPKDTFKSPAAMEVVLNSLHNTSDGNWFKQYWKGETRPWYSLEIISIEGQIKFYIWTEDDRKGGVMSALYSQYPGVEISEREDYSRAVQFDPKVNKIWAAEFKFTKPDPYPIKTYVDYGLDKDPKEEFKIDPLLPLLEWMGSVGPNQQVWIQIPIQAHYKNQLKPKTWFGKTDEWQDEAKEIVNKILLRDAKTKVAGEINKDTGFSKLPTISKGEQDIVEALERSVTKLAFDSGIRALYIAKRDCFNTPFGIGGIIGNLKQFNSEHLNGFKPDGSKWIPKVTEFPWQDFNNIRRNRQSRLVLQAYRRRSFFYPPFEGTKLVMNTEELATIYHFPGSVAGTPTLERIPSKKAEAPINLPV